MNTHKIKSALLLAACILSAAAQHSFGQVLITSNPNPNYSSLQLWLKADAGVTSSGNGTEVTAWANQSTSGVAVGGATALTGGGSGATLVSSSSGLNNQAALNFNGTNQGYNLPTWDLMTGSNFTMFTVIRQSSNTGVQVMLSAGSNIYAGFDGYLLYQTDVEYSTALSAPNVLLGNTSYVTSITHNGTAAGGTDLFVDGIQSDS